MGIFKNKKPAPPTAAQLKEVVQKFREKINALDEAFGQVQSAMGEFRVDDFHAARAANNAVDYYEMTRFWLAKFEASMNTVLRDEAQIAQAAAPVAAKGAGLRVMP
jgi:prefoldin subunit 5